MNIEVMKMILAILMSVTIVVTTYNVSVLVSSIKDIQKWIGDARGYQKGIYSRFDDLYKDRLAVSNREKSVLKAKVCQTLELKPETNAYGHKSYEHYSLETVNNILDLRIKKIDEYKNSNGIKGT